MLWEITQKQIFRKKILGKWVGGRGPGGSTPTPFVEGPVKTKNWKNDTFIKIGIKKMEEEATRILT